MSIELLELGAAALGGLVPEVAFLGGGSIELWITDPAAPPVRPTKDVDVVVEVVTLPPPPHQAAPRPAAWTSPASPDSSALESKA